MKKKFVLGIVILAVLVLIILLIGRYNSPIGGCPGRKNAKVEIEYYFEPTIEGLEIDPGYFCALDSNLSFGIENKMNNDILIYVDGKGVEHELQSLKEDYSNYDESSYVEEDIPQEAGIEWTRELYFKNSPNEKITLFAKNIKI